MMIQMRIWGSRSSGSHGIAKNAEREGAMVGPIHVV
jgi:hypothetical protein